MTRGIVIATPIEAGRRLDDYARQYDGPDQPPEDAVIGECVGEAVRAAWKAGHDPAGPNFVVEVVFK